MNVLDLYAGSKSLRQPTLDKGWNYFSIELEAEYKPDMVADIMNLTASDIPFKPNIIWASPPCTYFSVASIGRHWHKDHTPKTEQAIYGMELVKHTLELIRSIDPKYYFIENPRGKLRKLPFMQEFIRTTVSYCQYGDTRMKPTDIWHNNPKWLFMAKPICKNGDPCHEPAPRGSKSGTQGMKNNHERAKVPYELLSEILSVCE